MEVPIQSILALLDSVYNRQNSVDNRQIDDFRYGERPENAHSAMRSLDFTSCLRAQAVLCYREPDRAVGLPEQGLSGIAPLT